MRVIRSLMLLLGVAIAAAGCAQQPVAYMAYPSPAYPPPSIDNVVYGSGPQYAQPMPPATYAAAPQYAAPQYAATPIAPAPNAAPYAAPGYATVPAATAPSALYAYAAPTAVDGGYKLDSGDRLRIVVFGQEGLSNSYAVDAGGSIDMPLIGPVMARGATTDELANRISDKLRNGFIREPHVAVEIEAYRPFFILGEVAAPGQYPYVVNMTAETAVAIAGGFTPRALRKGVILNRNYNGRPMRIAVPLTFPLRPGDTINVQERWF
jgi:polysaccharide biosynthesis/export protein